MQLSNAHFILFKYLKVLDSVKNNFRIITSSFYEKSNIIHWLKPELLSSDFGDMIGPIWDTLVEKEMSFVVQDENNQMIGVSLNYDARDKPKLMVSGKMEYVLDFSQHIEGPIL